MSHITDIWVYLSASPLLWLTLTLCVYALASQLALRTRNAPWANPVAVSVTILGAILLFTNTPYPQYFEGAQFVHFLLGPATVALAVPLFRNRAEVMRSAAPMAAALIVGAAVAGGSALLIGRALGLETSLLAALAPKSTTAPIAMGIAENLGGLPSLTAALVILTGLTGALLGPPVLRLLGFRSEAAIGTALGLSAHGIGTARAFQQSEVAGTFAGIALGLTGVLSSLLVPALWRLLAP